MDKDMWGSVQSARLVDIGVMGKPRKADFHTVVEERLIVSRQMMEE